MGVESLERSPFEPLLKRALLVGIDAYQGGVAPLRKAVADASDLAFLLAEDFGFDVTLLLDGEATREAIEAVVAHDLAVPDQPTQWLFFFAGHGGFDEQGRGLLITAPSVGSEAIAVDELIQLCLEGGPGETLLLLDTCYSGRALVQPVHLVDRLPPEALRQQRIHQVLAASSPSQQAHELQHSQNSVFTSCLLDALSGWHPAHEPDGSIRFDRLNSFVTEAVARQLGQQVVGGNLVGTSRSPGIVLRPRVPRVPPAILADLAAGREEERILAFSTLLESCRQDPRLLPLALPLLLRHLPERSPDRQRTNGPPALTVDPGPEERRVAVAALGEITRLAQLDGSVVPKAFEVERAAARELLAQALEDPEPEVRRAARQGLRKVSPRVAARSASALTARRRKGDRQLRRQAWDALTAFSAGRKAVPLVLRWRIPLTLARLELSHGLWLFWASGERRRATLALAALTASFYMVAASTYHIDLAEPGLLVRSGLPAFRLAPGVGLPLIETGFFSDDLRPAAEAGRGLVVGFWPWRQNGAQLWGRQLAAHLKPAPAGLALWRLGDEAGAVAALSEGIAAGEAESVAMTGYIALQSSEPKRWLELLTPRLSGREELRAPARRALRALADVQPQAVSTALAGQISRLAEPPRPAAPPPAVLQAVPAPEHAIHDRRPVVRAEAVRQLVKRAFAGGTQPRALEPLLLAALEDRDEWVQVEAAVGIALLGDQIPAYLGQATQRLVAELVAEDLFAERLANWLPARFELASPAACRLFLEQLEPRLAELNPRQSFAFDRFLHALAPAAPGCVPALASFAVHRLTCGLDGTTVGMGGQEILWRLGELASSGRRAALEEQTAGLATATPAARAAAATAVSYLAARDLPDATAALEELRPLLTDSAPRVRSAATGALAVLGEVQSSLVPRVAPVLAPALADEDAAVRELAARAFQRLDPDGGSASVVVPRLAAALADSNGKVRREAARALGRWGQASPTFLSLATRAVQARLDTETDPDVALPLAAALGWLSGGDPALRRRVLMVARRGFAGHEAQQVLALEALELLGSAHPEAASQALGLLAGQLPHLTEAAAFRAILVMSQIGLSHPEGGALALSLAEPLLLKPAWPLREHALLNIPGPVCRQHPELASRGIRLLRRVLEQESGQGRSSFNRFALQALIEVGTLRALQEPESLWPLLWFPRSGERAAGLAVLAGLADGRPELIPALYARLAELRRWPQPHVRITAAQGEEMLAILERTRCALETPASYPHWRETLEALPEVGVRPAVRRALDRLEPGTSHQ